MIKKNTKSNLDIKKKPEWIKIRLPYNNHKIKKIKKIIKKNGLHSVCQEAMCPNISECFSNGTATFMILGNICTRKCSFCAVSKGRPLLVDLEEPIKLSNTILLMKINYVVITSVTRDDLKDGGSKQFVRCIKEIKKKTKNIKIEILVPDFKNCVNKAIKIISSNPPDIFNHNIENVPRLYKIIRPGANYSSSLKLLEKFKKKNSYIPTKSGLMLGLGEKYKEIIKVMKDLKSHGVNIITIGQYLQPSKKHLPVQRYITPLEFLHIKKEAFSIGFEKVVSGSFVRSSYRADLQYHGDII
ncbi:lipoyl synthase [Buchnera aphidicola (Taiwanaphis decaspermi)]|uniref:lipoyl synthase n=1 Tax=Buchnera aphidicola TaxID=9 RepID=UPI0031B852EB